MGRVWVSMNCEGRPSICNRLFRWWKPSELLSIFRGKSNGLRCYYYDCDPIWVYECTRSKPWVSQLEEIDAVDIWFYASGIATSPDVDAEMMVIAIPGKETGLIEQICGQFHAELLVESETGV